MKKLGLIALAVMVALGMLGIGYAYWTDSLTITGYIGTGSLSVEFTDYSTDDPENALDEPDSFFDVAETLVNLSGDNSVATITINNAYPGYETGVSLTVMNTGTVPAKVSSVVVAPLTPQDAAFFHFMSLGAWSFFDQDSNVLFPLDPGYVIMPGDTVTLDADFSFDANPDNNQLHQLPQGAVINLEATIVVTQFNDDATPVISIP